MSKTNQLLHVKSFFDIEPISKKRIKKFNKVDIFAWKEYDALTEALNTQRDKYHVRIPPTFVPNSEVNFRIFNNKAAWLGFMRNVGLGAHVPVVYSGTCDVYPCVLKNSVEHWGKGVHIVLNESHLKSVISHTVHGQESFHLEEGLNGWGPIEGSVYGSVYQGEMLSLRCYLKNHTVANSEQHSHSNARQGGLFVRGYQFNTPEWTDTHVPCGRDVYDVMSQMFAALDSPYIGAFCADFKGNNDLKPKFMEINARACGTHTSNEKLFVATYIPLAFAIRKDLLAKHMQSYVPDWYTDQKFIRVVEAERDNLRMLESNDEILFGIHRRQKHGTWRQGAGYM